MKSDGYDPLGWFNAAAPKRRPVWRGGNGQGRPNWLLRKVLKAQKNQRRVLRIGSRIVESPLSRERLLKISDQFGLDRQRRKENAL